MKNLSLLGAWVSALVFAPCAIQAQVSDVVGPGEYGYVGDGETLTRTTLVEGELRKTGEGTTDLPLSKLDGRGRIVVPSGNVALTDDGEAFVGQVPADALDKAAVWLDVSKDATVQLVEGSDSAVHQWLDVRETATSERGETGAYAYPHWMAGSASPTYHPAVGGENAYIDFGGYGSGQCFNCKDGSSKKIYAVRWAFLVYGTRDCKWGFVLGTDSASFVPASYGHEDGYYAILNSLAASANNQRMITGRFRLDREIVDPLVEKLREGYHLMAFPTGSSDFNVQSLFNDRDNSGRQGGGRLCEVLLFTCALSENERTAIENYLYRKWVTRTPDPPTFRIGSGASVSYDVAEGEVRDFFFGGESCVEKRGEGRLVGETADGHEKTSANAVILKGGSFDAALPVPLEVAETAAYCAATDGVCRVGVSAADALEKSGDGDLSVRSLATDVRKLDVKAGTLRLVQSVSSKEEDLPKFLRGTIEDPSFEAFSDCNIDEDGAFSVSSSGKHGWKTVNKYTTSGKGQVVRWKKDNTEKANYNRPGVTYPDGIYAGLLHLDGGLQTTVNLPVAGVYELSFWASQRTGYSGGEFRVTVDETDVAQVQTVGSMAFRKYAFRLPYLEAGDHTLTFQADANNNKVTSGLSSNYVCMFDDVHVDWISSVRPVAKVVNGGFERFPFLWTSAVGRPDIAPEDWVLSNDNATDSFILLPGREATTNVFGAALVARDIPEGGRALWMLGTPTLTGKVRVSAAGTYVLKARIGYEKPTGNKNEGLPLPSVSFALGSGLLSTSVTPDARGWTKDVEVGTFEVDADSVDQDLALVISGTVAGAVAILDDLRVEPAAEASAMRIVNTFDPAGWTTYETPSDVRDGSGQVQWGTYAGDVSWMQVRYDDAKCAKIRNQGILYRTEHLAAGAYRLSIAAIGRFYRYAAAGEEPDPDNLVRYGSLRIAPWVGSTDGTVTNRLGEFQVDTRERWRRHQFLFTIPADGDYRIGFSGLSVSDKAYDGTSVCSHGGILDGLVIEPVTLAEPMALDKSLTVAVAEGAKLALDNLTTNEVSEVRLGGRRCSGFITAERFPDYVTGQGALYAEPRGSVLFFR